MIPGNQFSTFQPTHVAAVALTALLLAAAPRPAAAGVVLEQDPIVNGGGVLSAGSFRSYDDFRLGTSTQVTAVRWWESNFNLGTQNFTISFLAGNWSNLPSLVPFYTTTVTATGTNFAAYTYQFEATLPAPVVLPANTDLWISIVDTSNSNLFFWARATGAASPGALPGGIMASLNADNALLLQGIDASWALISDPVSVPEPATTGLFGLALAAAGLLRRRGPTAA